jgi:D-xylose 1-dehydrogenase
LSEQGLSAHFQRVDLIDIAALRAGVAEARNALGAINIASPEMRHL